MSKNCLIIPVHRGKAPWFLGFLKSVFDNRGSLPPLDFDIIIATSNCEEMHFFARLIEALQISSNIVLISIDDYIEHNLLFHRLLQRYRANADRSVINIKKFAALHFVMEAHYDFAACIDCDSRAITDINGMFDKLVQNYELGMYFGAPCSARIFIADISVACRTLFSEADQIRINEFTRSGKMSPWFFDVPTYRLNDVRNFFSYMADSNGSLEDWFVKLKWGSFDHLVFIYWRCLNGYSKLIDYDADLGIPFVPEELGVNDLIRIYNEYAYSPIWMRAQEFANFPEAKVTLPQLRLIFHCDRLE